MYNLVLDLKKCLKETLLSFVESYPFTGTTSFAKSGCRTFAVIMDDKYIEIFCDTKLEDVKFILENFDSIEYIINISDNIDSVIGDLDDLYDEFNITDLQYICAVKHFGGNFTKENIVEFFTKEG